VKKSFKGIAVASPLLHEKEIPERFFSCDNIETDKKKVFGLLGD